MIMRKVLIVHPSFERLGGIETYLLKVGPRLRTSHIFCPIAQRPGETGRLGRLARIAGDYRRCWTMLADPEVDLVHINPSLEPKSFYREAVFLLLAKLRRKKTLVFFHGWRVGFQTRIDRRRGRLFRLLYGGADAFVVLASAFADSLRQWGITQPIYNETTVISDDAIADFDLVAAVDSRLQNAAPRLLLASRLMPTKGIGTTLEALKIIHQSHPEFELVVAGSGTYAEEAQALATRLELRQVAFLGAVPSERIFELMRTAHILCFPTEHDEGFPNAIVEAMAFGLPVVTRPVGGIPDFFESGVHGYLTASTSPADFAQLILRIMRSHDHYRAMAVTNHRYARTHFLASQASARLDGIYGTFAAGESP
jgi:glycosyltransferase involved in cell wall biosynthesis